MKQGLQDLAVSTLVSSPTKCEGGEETHLKVKWAFVSRINFLEYGDWSRAMK